MSKVPQVSGADVVCALQELRFAFQRQYGIHLIFIAVCAMCLLSGCQLKLEVFLYNNTDTSIMIGPSGSDQQLTIAPHAVANVNKYWEMTPAITQGGKTYRYLYPMSALPPGYTDGNGTKLSRRFEFGRDHRVYILPNGTLPKRTNPPQPADFPLEPLL